MKAEELREKSLEDLETELTALCREQFSLRMQKGSQLKTTHHIKRVRRAIARVKTLLHEKRSNQSGGENL